MLTDHDMPSPSTDNPLQGKLDAQGRYLLQLSEWAREGADTDGMPLDRDRSRTKPVR